MTAKEMFKKLDMECVGVADEKLVSYASKYPNKMLIKSKYIDFINNEKTVKTIVYSTMLNNVFINMNELEAIYQQCKELGWLESEKK